MLSERYHMNIREETEAVLKELRKLKIYRPQIEREQGYSKNYINQELSRHGGNPTLLDELKKYHQNIIDKMADPLPKILTLLEEMKAEVDIIYDREIERYAKEQQISEDAARQVMERLKREKMKKK